MIGGTGPSHANCPSNGSGNSSLWACRPSSQKASQGRTKAMFAFRSLRTMAICTLFPVPVPQHATPAAQRSRRQFGPPPESPSLHLSLLSRARWDRLRRNPLSAACVLTWHLASVTSVAILFARITFSTPAAGVATPYVWLVWTL
jgi:hypothetical protein